MILLLPIALGIGGLVDKMFLVNDGTVVLTDTSDSCEECFWYSWVWLVTTWIITDADNGCPCHLMAGSSS